jgi:hypothetical protein
MHRFKIVPTNKSYSSAEITSFDAGPVLNVVGHLHCGAADVLQDDVYSFSVHLNDNGLWTIFHRDGAQSEPLSSASPLLRHSPKG